MSQPYTVFKADIAANGEIVKALWLEGFALSTPESTQLKLDQMYLHNPAGQGLCSLLREEKSGNSVGVQCLVHRNFYCAGETFSAGIMADYVVQTKHRSLGPALQLLKECAKQGRSHFDFIYGFPNAKSDLIFKRAGFEPVGNIVRYAKLLRSSNFMRSRLPHWFSPIAAALVDITIWLGDQMHFLLHNRNIEYYDTSYFDVAFDKLWDHRASQELLLSERSARALTWRYPNSQNRRIFAVKDKNNGNLIGYCIWSRQNGAANIHDFFCKEPTQHLEVLLRNFSRYIRGEGASSFSLEFLGSPCLIKPLLRAGLKAREKTPIYFIKGDSNSPLSESNWYFTGFDRDTD